MPMHPLAWWTLSAPAVLLAVSLTPARLANANPRAMATAGLSAGVLALLVAMSVDAALVIHGPFWTTVAGFAGVGVSLYVDALSAAMFTLVAFIGVIVLLYSRNYLDGDRKQGSFFKRLSFTLAAVLTLISAGNLALLIVAWIATSVGLNTLLLFYPERPAAQLAAKKKFIACRLGDLFLIGAATSLWASFGTLAFPELFAAARAAAAAGAAGTLALPALLIALAALLKSAQLPFHGWLVEVMETPTPVSALLHAGVINAGGFLVLRLADIVAPSETALHVLALVGGATALFGSVVMLTQTSVKVALAYSTIAQMGFMMLECGLGAFAAALLHILAHSLYKAHAFLSSGSVIDLARASWTPSPGGQPHPARFALALVASMPVAFAVGGLFHAGVIDNPSAVTLGAILVMSLVHLVANALDERTKAYVLGRAIAMSVVVATAFFTLHAGVEWLFAASLPGAAQQHGREDIAIVLVIVVSFGAVTFFQSVMARHARSPFWQAAYVHLSQGLYLNALANRAMLRVWPRRATASSL
jgi:NAD(P)H-quinone oxidoreductase subunit 5